MAFVIDAEVVRANLARVRERIAAAGRDPATVRIVAATKYVEADDLPALARAGVEIAGENRADALVEKATRYGDLLRFEFIGQLQSRKVRLILPHVGLIHSVASESALTQIGRHRDLARADLRILLEVNVSGDRDKAGLDPGAVGSMIGISPVPVVGLMTMPPLARDGEANREHFAALRELAHQHGLRELSMGTSQDYEVAVAEGATMVRLGTSLYSGRDSVPRGENPS